MLKFSGDQSTVKRVTQQNLVIAVWNQQVFNQTYLSCILLCTSPFIRSVGQKSASGIFVTKSRHSLFTKYM